MPPTKPSLDVQFRKTLVLVLTLTILNPKEAAIDPTWERSMIGGPLLRSYFLKLYGVILSVSSVSRDQEARTDPAAPDAQPSATSNPIGEYLTDSDCFQNWRRDNTKFKKMLNKAAHDLSSRATTFRRSCLLFYACNDIPWSRSPVGKSR